MTTQLCRKIMRISLFLSALVFSASVLADTPELIRALQSGEHIALMRHSIAPGTGDPSNLRIGDCTTQRNLSDGGRAQAGEIGETLRASGLTEARLVSSQWCRCLETARLMSIGGVEELSFLNSLIAYRGQNAEMTGGLRDWISEQDLSTPTILVTHSVNIGALIGGYPREGEIIVARRTESGDFIVVGSIQPQ
ncbi:MAG: histidine phosphatase family protein [Gammaproteobacteria bacterium]|nr:histidine phosphatase family protein [Gammaproteobacteria bacterium]